MKREEQQNLTWKKKHQHSDERSKWRMVNTQVKFVWVLVGILDSRFSLLAASASTQTVQVHIEIENKVQTANPKPSVFIVIVSFPRFFFYNIHTYKWANVCIGCACWRSWWRKKNFVLLFMIQQNIAATAEWSSSSGCVCFRCAQIKRSPWISGPISAINGHVYSLALLNIVMSINFLVAITNLIDCQMEGEPSHSEIAIIANQSKIPPHRSPPFSYFLIRLPPIHQNS